MQSTKILSTETIHTNISISLVSTISQCDNILTLRFKVCVPSEILSLVTNFIERMRTFHSAINACSYSDLYGHYILK